MKLKLLFCIMAIVISDSSIAQYRADELKNGFECRTIDMGRDYEGKVVCTLIRHKAQKPTSKAVLYIHGFNDYFFQTELAERFNEKGYNFYAVDLRKYGRSTLSHQKQCNMRDISEFFADIDTCVSIIKSENNSELIIMGHSTGGLTAALYCDSKGDKSPASALILNSPFLELNMNWFLRNIAIPVISWYSNIDPNLTINQSKSTGYGESLNKNYHGEWVFDEKKKPRQSVPVTSGWIHAIYEAQKKVHSGLTVTCPILVMYSDKSVNYSDWSPKMQYADAVLNVDDIAFYGMRLGKDITRLKVKGGMHDIICSAPCVRNAAYKKIFEWLQSKTKVIE